MCVWVSTCFCVNLGSLQWHACVLACLHVFLHAGVCVLVCRSKCVRACVRVFMCKCMSGSEQALVTSKASSVGGLILDGMGWQISTAG